VDQQVVEVDRREVDNCVVSPLPIITWSTALILSLKNKLYKKREHENGDLKYIHGNEGTKFPERTNIVQQYKCTIYTKRGSLV